MTPRVFVVQRQLRWDEQAQGLVSKFDLEPAQEHGELVFLLGSNASPFSPRNIIPELHAKLSDFSDDDHLLLIGNPCLIGWATSIAADYNEGRVSLLQWSGKDRRYVSVRASLFDWPQNSRV